MSDLYIKVKKNEDYEDVHEEIMFDDFLQDPNAFEVEILFQKIQDRGMVFDVTRGESPWSDVSQLEIKYAKLRAKLQQIIDDGIDTSTDGGMDFIRAMLKESK